MVAAIPVIVEAILGILDLFEQSQKRAKLADTAALEAYINERTKIRKSLVALLEASVATPPAAPTPPAAIEVTATAPASV